ncbi:hypothetical protein HK100_007864, partial [Physocladia obscura]
MFEIIIFIPRQLDGLDLKEEGGKSGDGNDGAVGRSIRLCGCGGVGGGGGGGGGGAGDGELGREAVAPDLAGNELRGRGRGGGAGLDGRLDDGDAERDGVVGVGVVLSAR